MDFRLDKDIVRNPDVAFISSEHLRKVDPDHSPIEGAPALAIEVISPYNLAQDTRKKIQQYLAAGCQAVWIVYPKLKMIEIHAAGTIREFRESAAITEEKLFPGLGFTLPLTVIFDDDLQK
jgi:Uma2 family endonuclease